MNLIDPLGLFSWDKFFKGLSAVVVGVVAVAAVIATGGAATPLVAAGLAVTAAAGTTSAIFGAYDIYESVTDKNQLKDAIGEPAYEIIEFGSEVVASAGTGWIATNPQNFNNYTDNSSFNKYKPTIDSKQLGKKFGKHATDFNLPKTAEGVQQYQLIVDNCISNVESIRIGDWGSLGQCEFWICGNTVTIVCCGDWVSTFPLTQEGTISYILSLTEVWKK